MIDLHIAKSLAMSYAIEDLYGPYELIWGLNKHYPDESAETKQAAAKEVLGQLLREGLIEFHECGLLPCESPVSESLAIAVLSGPSIWLTPGESRQAPFYWFGATEAGEQAYYEGRFKSL